MPTTEKERYSRLRRVFRDVTYMGAPYLEPLNIPSPPIETRSADGLTTRRRSRSRDSVNSRGSKSAGHTLRTADAENTDTEVEDSDAKKNTKKAKRSKYRRLHSRTYASGGTFVRSNLRGSHTYRPKSSGKRKSEKNNDSDNEAELNSKINRDVNSSIPTRRSKRGSRESRQSKRPTGSRHSKRRTSSTGSTTSQQGAYNELALDLPADDESETGEGSVYQRGRQKTRRPRRLGGLYRRNIPSLHSLTDANLYGSSAPGSRDGSVVAGSRENSLPPTPRTSDQDFGRYRRPRDESLDRRSRAPSRSESTTSTTTRGWELPPLRVNQTPLPQLPGKNKQVTADDLMKIRKQVTETLASYYGSVRRQHVAHAKQGWDDLLPQDIPTRHLRHTFSQAFWTYLPQTGNDLMTKPWLPHDGVRGNGTGGGAGRFVKIS